SSSLVLVPEEKDRGRGRGTRTRRNGTLKLEGFSQLEVQVPAHRNRVTDAADRSAVLRLEILVIDQIGAGRRDRQDAAANLDRREIHREPLGAVDRAPGGLDFSGEPWSCREHNLSIGRHIVQQSRRHPRSGNIGRSERFEGLDDNYSSRGNGRGGSCWQMRQSRETRDRDQDFLFHEQIKKGQDLWSTINSSR